MRSVPLGAYIKSGGSMRRLLVLLPLFGPIACGQTCGPGACYPEEIGCGSSSYVYGHEYRYYGDGRLCGEPFPVSRRLPVHDPDGP